jgi:hypothetical protein
MALCLIAVLLVVVFAQYQYNKDLRWWAKHYKRELDSQTAFARQLTEMVTENGRMLMALPRQPKPPPDDGDWDEYIDVR